MLVQRREWDAGMDADAAARHGYNPRDFDLGHELRLVDGEHDVFGDGSVVCLPTHGHTPRAPVVEGAARQRRHRARRRRLLFLSDAPGAPPAALRRDREGMLASLDRLEALERGGARLFFGHDPEFWRTVPQAPTPIA